MDNGILKCFRLLLLFFTIAVLTNCSGDDANDNQNIVNNEYNTQRATIITLAANTVVSSDATYNWTVKTAPSENYSLANAASKEALFAAAEIGIYELEVIISDKGNTQTQNVKVNVTKENKEYKTFIAKVFEFKPAPGQFINDLPAANDGETTARILERANTYLAKKDGNLVSLGAFGGYVVFGFDHSVVNVKGKRDFRILGNAFMVKIIISQ